MWVLGGEPTIPQTPPDEDTPSIYPKYTQPTINSVLLTLIVLIIVWQGLPGAVSYGGYPGGQPNVPLVESVKDQHLLKPPPSMENSNTPTTHHISCFKTSNKLLFSASGFGRRASDGGANPSSKSSSPCGAVGGGVGGYPECGGWSHPSSREQLSTGVLRRDATYATTPEEELLLFRGGTGVGGRSRRTGLITGINTLTH